MRSRGGLSAIPRLTGTLTVLAAFAVSLYLFVRAEAAATPERAAPPAVSVDAIPTVSIPPFRDALPVLVYHDIAQRPGRYTVSPQRFAEQMAALQRAGFHAISARQLLGFLRQRTPLPIRPVLITFDDGLGSTWRIADPILARYGLRAIDFVISGQVGKHGLYYLRRAEAEAMIRSGRWDVEAHTHLAHLYIQTDRYGDYGPALANRAWLPQQNRNETRSEYALRVQRDLTLNVSELRGLGADPTLFAYPFSASRTPTNDPGVVPILHRLVQQTFQVSFVDGDGSQLLNRYNVGNFHQLARIEVYEYTTAAALLGRIARLVPQLPHVGNALAQPGRWFDAKGRPIGGQAAINHAVLHLRAGVRRWLAVFFSPQESQLWRGYRVRVTLQGLGGKRSGTSDTLLLGAADAGHCAVTVSSARIRIVNIGRNGLSRTIRLAPIPPAASHRLDVTLHDSQLRVAVDGRALPPSGVARDIHGGVGLGGWRELQRSPAPAFAQLSLSA